MQAGWAGAAQAGCVSRAGVGCCPAAPRARRGPSQPRRRLGKQRVEAGGGLALALGPADHVEALVQGFIIQQRLDHELQGKGRGEGGQRSPGPSLQLACQARARAPRCPPGGPAALLGFAARPRVHLGHVGAGDGAGAARRVHERVALAHQQLAVAPRLVQQAAGVDHCRERGRRQQEELQLASSRGERGGCSAVASLINSRHLQPHGLATPV